MNHHASITSAMGSLRALRVTRNLIPSFSSCLDKTRMIVAELRRSSSNFSTLSSRFTSTPPFTVSRHTRLHCLFRIHAPIATPPANSTTPHTETLFPISTRTAFFQPRLAAIPTETATVDETRQSNSAIERNESKSKPLPTMSSLCKAESDS